MISLCDCARHEHGRISGILRGINYKFNPNIMVKTITGFTSHGKEVTSLIDDWNFIFGQ